MLQHILVTVMVNFHKTAQHPGSLITMIREIFPRSTLVPCACLTFLTQDPCKMDALAMRSLFTQMGCSNQAANAIVDDQGINRLHELCYLTNTDIETLCKNVKHPGGVAAGNRGGANLGHMISHRAEMNIMLAAYWLWYSEKISHPRIGADVTVPVVRSIDALHDTEGTYNDPSTPTIDDQNWPRTFNTSSTQHIDYPNITI